MAVGEDASPRWRSSSALGFSRGVDRRKGFLLPVFVSRTDRDIHHSHGYVCDALGSVHARRTPMRASFSPIVPIEDEDDFAFSHSQRSPHPAAVIEIKNQAEWDAQMSSNPGKAVRRRANERASLDASGPASLTTSAFFCL